MKTVPSPRPESSALVDVRPIQTGVIGLGRAGTFFHCEILARDPRFALAAVCDPRAAVVDKISQTYQVTGSTDYRTLLANADLDLIVIAVPTAKHRKIALEAIDAGRSILVEKPFAVSAEEAREIFEAGERAGVFVGGFHNRRFDPDVRTLRQILQSGVLGPLVKVSIHLHSYARRKDWQTLRQKGGGALANWGAHALDWCYDLFGGRVECRSSQLFQVLNPGNAEDSFHLLLSAPLAPVIHLEYFNCAAKPLPKWHIVGRHGTLISGDNVFHLRTCNPNCLVPIEAESGDASDGTYMVNEDLGWSEEVVPWGHWDCRPFFYEQLHAHLREGAAAPVGSRDIIAQLRLMEEIRRQDVLVMNQTAD